MSFHHDFQKYRSGQASCVFCEKPSVFVVNLYAAQPGFYRAFGLPQFFIEHILGENNTSRLMLGRQKREKFGDTVGL